MEKMKAKIKQNHTKSNSYKAKVTEYNIREKGREEN